MDVRHHPPIDVPLVADLWASHWTDLRQTMDIGGHEARKWLPVFRSDFYIVTLHTLTTTREMAHACKRHHDDIDRFLDHLAQLQSDVEAAQREWQEQRLAERIEALNQSPWLVRVLHRLIVGKTL